MKLIFSFIFLGLVLQTQAQNVGIGTTSPNGSAQLDVNSTSKGLLVPRMAMAQRNTIAAPATGLLIYQLDNSPGFYYYNGASWTPILGGSTGWSTMGNTGTHPSTNFLGTIDNAPLIFKIDNTKAGMLGLNGNAFWGKGSGLNINGAYYNTAIGFNALKGSINGQANVAIGNCALSEGTNGNELVAIGDSALSFNIGHTANTAVGSRSLRRNTTGFQNTAIGYRTLYTNTTGSNNTAVGNRSLYDNTTGTGNTAVGIYALSKNETGGYNTAIGNEALTNNDIGTKNVSFGWHSMFMNIDGDNNTASGYQAMNNNTSGSNNTASGIGALAKNETGINNTAIGAYSLGQNIGGVSNTAIGYSSMSGNISGYNNTTLGNESNVAAAIHHATAVGSNAFVASSNSLVLGSISGVNGATANTKVGIGTSEPASTLSVKSNQQGRLASFDGESGMYVTINENGNYLGYWGSYTGGPNDVDFGTKAGSIAKMHLVTNAYPRLTIDKDGKTGIGTTSPQHFLHISANSAFDDSVQLCLEENTSTDFARLKFINNGVNTYWDIASHNNASAANARMNFYFDGVGDILSLHGDGNAILMGTLTQNSDARLKKNILPLSNSLTSIMALNGYQYQWKDKNRDDAPQIGLLAQEVQKLFPALVKEDDKGILSVNYTGLIPVMIEAMKQQQETITEQQKNYRDLQKKVIQQQLQMDALMKRLNTLEQKL